MNDKNMNEKINSMMQIPLTINQYFFEKKIDKINEARAIGICTKTIFNRKGYTRGKFKCKGKSTVKFNKTLKKKI